MKILLTSLPGTGKSTIIKKVIDTYSGEKYGVMALEIRDENNNRLGFKAVNLEGKRKVFMHKTDIKSDVIVGGKYYVDVEVLDTFVTNELKKGLNKEKILILVDEIGRAQSNSNVFLETVRELLDSNSNLLGSIVYDNEAWSLEFKLHPEIILIEVTEVNRDYIPEILVRVFENTQYFNQLSDSQQQFVISELTSFILKGEYIQAKKLFANAIVYVARKQVTKVYETSDTISYAIVGKTNNHITTYNKHNTDYKCDCDLFNGRGQFKNKAGECSHIESIKILNQ